MSHGYLPCQRRRLGSARHRRGAIVLEMLVGTTGAVLLGTALVMLMVTTYQVRNTLQGQSNTDWQVRSAINTLADSISNAQSYQISASPSTYSALQAATSNSVTCYTSSSTGAYRKYWYDSATKTIKRTTSTNSTSTLVRSVDSVSFTYYVSGGQFTNTSANWVTTASPSAPTSAELPTIGAVKITVGMTVNGYTRQYTTLVRMRNSPL